MPARYFTSDKCEDVRVRGKTSLADAALELWDLAPEDFEPVESQIREQLESGAFHYLLVAQRFTPTIESTIEYLNAVTAGPSFYAVELVRFAAAEGTNAFESRTILKAPRRTPGNPRTKITLTQFLDRVGPIEYRNFLEDLLGIATGLQLRIEPGDSGLSLRIPVGGGRPPFSIGWVFPPGKIGWKKFTDVTLGYVLGKIEAPPEPLRQALEKYSAKVGAMPGARRIPDKKFDAFTLDPEQALQSKLQIVAAIEEIVGAFRQALG